MAPGLIDQVPCHDGRILRVPASQWASPEIDGILHQQSLRTCYQSPEDSRTACAANGPPAVDGVDSGDDFGDRRLVELHGGLVTEEIGALLGSRAPGHDLIDAARVAPVVHQAQNHLHSPHTCHVMCDHMIGLSCLRDFTRTGKVAASCSFKSLLQNFRVQIWHDHGDCKCHVD